MDSHDVLISYLDGTHSLKWIHWWLSILMKKKKLIYILDDLRVITFSAKLHFWRTIPLTQWIICVKTITNFVTKHTGNHVETSWNEHSKWYPQEPDEIELQIPSPAHRSVYKNRCNPDKKKQWRLPLCKTVLTYIYNIYIYINIYIYK